MADDILFIETGNQRLSGWLTSSVTRGVELCPSHANFTITERFPSEFMKAVVLPGNPCRVLLGDDLVLTGWIDEYSPSYDGHSHNVNISCRSKTEDVVDASYFPGEDGQWAIPAGMSLKAAVELILKPLPEVKLNFQAEDATIPQPGHAIHHGESVYSAIEALTRMTSKLFWDDEEGNVVISDVGTEHAGSPLVEGVNVEAAVTRINWVQRFFQVVVMTEGTDPDSGSVHHSVLSKSDTDNTPGVRPERIKVIVPENSVNDGTILKKRADWELNRRIGRSLQVQIHVVGWRDAGGKLWKPNTIATVKLPEQKVETDLVITEVEWSRDDQGTHTILTLMPAAALQPQPYIEPLGSGQSRNGVYG